MAILYTLYVVPYTGGHGGGGLSYCVGALSALFSALVAGLLPVCTRRSKARSVQYKAARLHAKEQGARLDGSLFILYFSVTHWLVLRNQACAWTAVNHCSLAPGLREWRACMGCCP